MNRDNIFFLPENAPGTFSRDESLAPLPLPKLEATLERYYKSLIPFGTKEELTNSRRIIEEFRNGIGKKLQAQLEEKAKTEKNWVEKWWEDIAYLSLKTPLLPYCQMASPLILSTVGVEESEANRLKVLARLIHFSAQYWKLIRNERLRPPTNPDGSITFSSNLYRRLFNSVRLPGIDKDTLKTYFNTVSEGPCPSHALIIGNGRLFTFDTLNADGTLCSPQHILFLLKQIQFTNDNEVSTGGIPILTWDQRDGWAKNREYLKELSTNNSNLLTELESASMTFCLDSSSPANYSESSLRSIDGDYQSRWTDKGSCVASFKNGKIGCFGEHSLYDGTISISLSFYYLLSFMEEPEPDWDETPKKLSTPRELKFDIDEKLRVEIARMEEYCQEIKNSVIANCTQFEGYGKQFMKENKVHPDSYIQTVLQWAYYKMHGSFPPTYETATMRVFYHGRTETVRSCSTATVEWVDKMKDPEANTAIKAKLFKAAAKEQNNLMIEARKGNGIDRHLFGLWCTAFENKMEVPELFNDPMYQKSGGGGNFVLSTSTLGYTSNVGFVAPMLLDGYGVFYSMLNDCVWMITTSYRGSEHTSAHKLYKSFAESMLEIQDILMKSPEAKM